MLIALEAWKVIARPPQLGQTLALQDGKLEAEVDWPPEWGRPTAALLLPMQAESADDDFFLARNGRIVRDPSAADIQARAQRFDPLPDTPTRLAGLPWPPGVDWALPLLLFRSNTPLFHAQVRHKIDAVLADTGHWSSAEAFERDFARQLNAAHLQEALIHLAAASLSDAEIAEAAATYLRDHAPIAPGLGPIRRP